MKNNTGSGLAITLLVAGIAVGAYGYAQPASVPGWIWAVARPVGKWFAGFAPPLPFNFSWPAFGLGILTIVFLGLLSVALYWPWLILKAKFQMGLGKTIAGKELKGDENAELAAAIRAKKPRRPEPKRRKRR